MHRGRGVLDHTREFHPREGDREPGGDTSAANLAPLCRRDHRLKTDGGHHLHQVSPGRFVWVTPTGKTYTDQPGIDPPPPPPREPDLDDGTPIPPHREHDPVDDPVHPAPTTPRPSTSADGIEEPPPF